MKLKLKQLITKDDFNTLEKGDRCLIAIRGGCPHIRKFKAFSYIGKDNPYYEDDYYRGTWIHFEESSSCDFTVERYFNGNCKVTDIYLIK